MNKMYLVNLSFFLEALLKLVLQVLLSKRPEYSLTPSLPLIVPDGLQARDELHDLVGGH